MPLPHRRIHGATGLFVGGGRLRQVAPRRAKNTLPISGTDFETGCPNLGAHHSLLIKATTPFPFRIHGLEFQCCGLMVLYQRSAHVRYPHQACLLPL